MIVCYGRMLSHDIPIMQHLECVHMFIEMKWVKVTLEKFEIDMFFLLLNK